MIDDKYAATMRLRSSGWPLCYVVMEGVIPHSQDLPRHLLFMRKYLQRTPAQHALIIFGKISDCL